MNICTGVTGQPIYLPLVQKDLICHFYNNFLSLIVIIYLTPEVEDTFKMIYSVPWVDIFQFSYGHLIFGIQMTFKCKAMISAYQN